MRAELVHALLDDMPDTQALQAAPQLLKQQMGDCPVDGSSEGPVKLHNGTTRCQP